jgi:drug/metabolite transporter (DMT)-like permease
VNTMLFKRFAAFAALIIAWASIFPVIKIGIVDSPPLFFAGIRTLLGGLCLLVVALIWGGRVQWRSAWPIYLISSILSVQIFFGLQTMAIQYISSGLTAVLVYLQPVLVGILAWKWLGEPLSARKILGLILGFIGVAIISMDGIAGSFSIVGILLGVASAFSWAFGAIYFKRIQEAVSLYWLVCIQFILGGIALIAAGLVWESWRDIIWSPRFWFSSVYSALIGIAFAYLIYLKLLKAGEASRISAYLFVVPLISVVLGITFLDETITIPFLIGGSLIVSGIYLVNRQAKPEEAAVLSTHQSEQK